MWVRGDVELVGTRATLRAVDVPAEQFVELRTLIPRTAFTSTSGMRVERGNALRSHRRGGARRRRALRDRSRPHRRAEGTSAPNGPRRARRSRRSRRFSSSGWSSGSWGASAGRATTASTSRSLRPTPSPRSFRRSCDRAARPARTSSRRRCSTSSAEASTRPCRRRLRSPSGAGCAARRSPTSSSRPARIASCARGSATSPTSSTACSTAAASDSRASATRSRTSASRCTAGSRRSRTRLPPRRSASRGSARRERSRSSLAVVLFAVAGGAARLPRRARLATRVPALLGRPARRHRRVSHRERRALPRHARVQPPRVAAPNARGAGRGGALGGVSPLPLGLPAPAGSTAGDARALGALPRLRHRVRDRRARPPGSAAPHAGSARGRRARSTGSHRTATSARARRASRSATSRPASATRSHRRTRVAAVAEAASPAAVEVAVVAAVAALARDSHVLKSHLVPRARTWHAEPQSSRAAIDAKRCAPTAHPSTGSTAPVDPPFGGVRSVLRADYCEDQGSHRKDLRLCSPREIRATSLSQ